MMKTSKQLPPLYYLEIWYDIVSKVSRCYGHVISDNIKDFIQLFYQLPVDQQAILVRVILKNKKKCHKKTDFCYDEILNPQLAISTLIQLQLFSPPSIEDYPIIIQSMTVVELKQLCRSLNHRISFGPMKKKN